MKTRKSVMTNKGMMLWAMLCFLVCSLGAMEEGSYSGSEEEYEDYDLAFFANDENYRGQFPESSEQSNAVEALVRISDEPKALKALSSPEKLLTPEQQQKIQDIVLELNKWLSQLKPGSMRLDNKIIPLLWELSNMDKKLFEEYKAQYFTILGQPSVRIELEDIITNAPEKDFSTVEGAIITQLKADTAATNKLLYKLSDELMEEYVAIVKRGVQ